MTTELRKVHHTGINVTELERSVAFYTLIGFAPVLEQPLRKPEPTVPEAAPVSTTGRAHIAVAVDDVTAESQRLTAAGITFVSAPVTVPDGNLAGVTAVYARDPDGNSVEILSGL